MRNIYLLSIMLSVDDSKKDNLMDKNNNYLHRWFLPMNILQYETPYSGIPAGNSPEFIPLDNILDRYILHSLRLHCVLSRFFLDGEGTDKEDRNMRFSFSCQSKSPEGWSVYGNRNWEPLLRRGLSNMSIWCWKHWKLSTVHMGLHLGGWLVVMDTDGKW